MNLSLRTKGILAVMVLIGYLALISVFLAHERQNLVSIVGELETSQRHQALLAPLVGTLAHSIVDTQAILNSYGERAGTAAPYGDLPSHFDAISANLQEAQKFYPALTPELRNFMRAVAAMRGSPSGPNLAQMRDSEQELMVKVHDTVTGLQGHSAELADQYHDTQQFISNFAVIANIVGAVASVAVILMFFTRLARDIRRLQDRSVAIVAGYDGAPLRNTRRDEVGGLIDSVNRMQVDLRRWEKQMEVERQLRSHHEKMAAVGSLAAAIGHEVSNPIAAIAGVAQFIVDETSRDDRPSSRSVNEFASQILGQTERISRIMRKMATLTAPHPPDAEMLDLNALIQSTCGFIGYDKRFRGVEFEFDLHHDLPAITAVADHLTQVLMNLLINAADAMDHATEAGARKIRIATSVVADGVVIAVSDNGRGMSPEVLARAFDESFSTKSAGKGRGLGLFVCKTLMEESGGSIALASVPNDGTVAKLHLPLRTSEKMAA